MWLARPEGSWSSGGDGPAGWALVKPKVANLGLRVRSKGTVANQPGAGAGR